MAVTTDAQDTRIEPIDPGADPHVEDVSVAIPDLRGIDLQRVVFNYDRNSDILLFYPYGKDRPAVAAGGSENVYVLIDPDSEEFVGIQIEDFLSRAVKDQPTLLEVFEVAELQGMTIADVRQERQRTLGYRGRFRAWLTRMVRNAPWRQNSIRQRAVHEIINEKHLRCTDGPALEAI